MKQNDHLLRNKLPIVSPHDRSIGSVVSYPNTASINSDFVFSLRPHYEKRTSISITPVTRDSLLCKEPIRQTNTIKPLTPTHPTANISVRNAASIKHPNDYNPSVENPSTLHPSSSILQQTDSDRSLLIFYIAISVITHILAVILIYIWYWFYPHHSTRGNNEQGQPVEVVFAPDQTGSSGLTGEGLTGDNGQPPPPPPPPTSIPEISSPPVTEQTVSVPEPETEPLPDGEAIPTPIPQQQTNTPKKQLTKNHQYTYHYTPPRQQHRQQVAPKSSNNPFENMQSLDFSENPRKSRRQAATHKLPQGSRSSVDMSTGPLVKNGQINVPYAAKISIKGVSDEYGDEINAWIRQHLYYPADAARNGEDGSASVHVALNRDGYVLSASLTGSSGSEALDSAILSMFRGARLPKIPPDLPDHFELDLTVNYILLGR